MGGMIEQNVIERPTKIDSREWGFSDTVLEFKIYSFAFGDHRSVGPHNVDAFIECKRKRDTHIEELLTDGWEIVEKIICPPNVMLILSRIRETKENERKQ